MASILRSYNAALIRRPMFIQCLTAGALFGAGDLIAQQAVEGRGRDHDWMRTGRLVFYRSAMFGPLLTKWFDVLNRVKFPSPTKTVLLRVWLDQALVAPVAIAFFYGSMSVLEGTPDECIPRVQASFAPTLVRSWCVYVPAQLVNFWLVPPHMRLVVISVVSLCWNTYLSAANASASAQKQSPITGTGIKKMEAGAL